MEIIISQHFHMYNHISFIVYNFKLDISILLWKYYILNFTLFILFIYMHRDSRHMYNHISHYSSLNFSFSNQFSNQLLRTGIKLQQSLKVDGPITHSLKFIVCQEGYTVYLPSLWQYSTYVASSHLILYTLYATFIYITKERLNLGTSLRKTLLNWIN